MRSCFSRHKSVEPYLGKVTITPVEEGRFVANLYQQATIKSLNPEISRHVSYDAFYNGLCELKRIFADNPQHFGFPKKIGSDRAGGDWRIILAMIQSVFDDSTVTIVELKQ